MWFESHTFGWLGASGAPSGGLEDEITGCRSALKQFHAEPCDVGHCCQARRPFSEAPPRDTSRALSGGEQSRPELPVRSAAAVHGGAAGYLPSPADPGRPCPRSRRTVPTICRSLSRLPTANRPVPVPAGPGRLRSWQVLPGLPGTEIAAPLRDAAVHLPSPEGLGPLHLSPGKPSPRPAGTRRGSPPRPGRAPATNRHSTSSIAPAMCPRASSRAGVTPRTPLPYATSPKFFLDAPSGPSAVETSGPRPSYADRRIFSSHRQTRGGGGGSPGREFTWKCVPAWSRRPGCPRAGTGPC